MGMWLRFLLLTGMKITYLVMGYGVKTLNIMLVHREFDFMHTKQNKLANEIISQMPTI